MNTYRYEQEQRRNWVRDKKTRAKTVRQICQEASISRATLYNWIDEFADDQELIKMDEAAAAIPRQVQKTSRPELLNRIHTENGERYRMLVSAISGIDHSRSFSKKLVAVLIKRFTLSVSQACAIVGMPEAEYGYKPRKPEVEDYIVYEGLVTLIREDRTRSFEELYELLQQKNPDWTRKQMKRVYRDGMVYLERTRARKSQQNIIASEAETAIATPPGITAVQPSAIRRRQSGSTWQMGLLEDIIIKDGQPNSLWLVFIYDEESGLPLNAAAGTGSITTENLLQFLERAAVENGSPRKLKVPGKPAFSVRELTRWVWEHKMALHTFSLQKPENLSEIRGIEALVKEQLQLNEGSSFTELEERMEQWIGENEG